MPKVIMRDGHKVHVRVIGKGPAIVLLHGFAMQSLHWMPFALPLSLKYRVIIPDLRGFGKSHCTPYNNDCVITNFVEDINDIADHLKLDRFKLAGISMGALTGLKYVSEHPHRVSHYLHIDQAPKCMNTRDWNWGLFGGDNKLRVERGRQLIERLEPYAQKNVPFRKLPKELSTQLWRELGDFFASALSKPAQKEFAQKVGQFPGLMSLLMPTQNWQAYLHCMKAYLHQDYDMLSRLKHIKTPLSVLVGLKSDMYPCGGQLRMADHAPNCQIIPFAESGHAPLLDEPVKFLQELNTLANA